MYEKTYKKDGSTITEVYESWYEVWLAGWYASFIYTFCGVLAFVVTPFIAIRSIWKPNCIGRTEHHEETFLQTMHTEEEA